MPQFDIPSLSALQDVTVPTGFEDDLRRLNASIPSLEELRDVMTQLIEVPFEKMKAELNSTFGELIGNVTTASLPTIRSTAATLASTPNDKVQICQGMDVSFVDDVAASLAKLARISTALIIAGFFLLWIALIRWEWYNWKVLSEQAEYLVSRVEQDLQAGRTVDGMVMTQIVEHPILEKYGEMVFRKFQLKSSTRRNFRWFREHILLIIVGILLSLAVSRLHLSPSSACAPLFRPVVPTCHSMPDRGDICIAQ